MKLGDVELVYFHSSEGPRSIEKIAEATPLPRRLEVNPSFHKPGFLWVRLACKEIWLTPYELRKLGHMCLNAAEEFNG